MLRLSYGDSEVDIRTRNGGNISPGGVGDGPCSRTGAGEA